MDLLTKDYKVYKALKKVILGLFVLLLLSLLLVAYEGFRLIQLTTDINSYTPPEKKVSSVRLEIENIEEEIVRQEELLAYMSGDGVSDTPYVLEELEGYSPDKIMSTIRNSTNNGIKLHNITQMGGELIIAGVSTEIEGISSFVRALDEYYYVDINKTQQINHQTEGLHYAFEVRLKVKGE